MRRWFSQDCTEWVKNCIPECQGMRNSNIVRTDRGGGIFLYDNQPKPKLQGCRVSRTSSNLDGFADGFLQYRDPGSRISGATLSWEGHFSLSNWNYLNPNIVPCAQLYQCICVTTTTAGHWRSTVNIFLSEWSWSFSNRSNMSSYKPIFSWDQNCWIQFHTDLDSDSATNIRLSEFRHV